MSGNPNLAEAEQRFPDPALSVRTRLAGLIRDYQGRPAGQVPGGLVGYVRREDPYLFSHHDPRGSCFRDHVFHLGGWYVCRGCVVTGIAGLLSFALALSTRWPVLLDASQLGRVFVVLLLLSVVPLRQRSRTWRNDARRVILGTLTGSAIATLALPGSFWVKAWILTCYPAGLALGHVWRKRQRGTR